MPYKLAPLAYISVENIFYEGLIEFGEWQAIKYQSQLHNMFELLAFMPTMGRKSERHVSDQYRFAHHNYVIYYRTMDDHILIDDIVHACTVTDPWGDNN